MDCAVTASYHTYETGPGSGTLIVDLVLDPKKDIKEIEQIEVYVGIGYKEPALFPIGQYFYLPTKA